MAKARSRKVVRRKRRPIFKLFMALAACGLAFGGAAVATLWVMEVTRLLAPAVSSEESGEDITAEERRSLERIIEEGAKNP